MSIEIPEEPDFNDLEKKLSKSSKQDFLKYILKDYKPKNEDAEIILKHFHHYTNCITKLFDVVSKQDDKIKLLESGMEWNAELIDKLKNQSNENAIEIENLKKKKSWF